jgi:uncharacterized protein YcfJ
MAKKCKTGQYYDKKLKKCRDTYETKEKKDKGMAKGYAVGGLIGHKAAKHMKSSKSKATALVGSAVAGALIGRYKAGRKKKKKK